MEATKYVWMDGSVVEWNNAKIHVMTHSFHHGTAVFEGIRFYSLGNKSALFRLDEHLKRFFYSSKILNMNLQLSKEQLTAAIKKIVKANEVKSGYVRPFAYYGYGSISVIPPSDCPVNVFISVWPWKQQKNKGLLNVKISHYTRLHPNSIDIKAKISGYYINSVLAGIEARNSGFDDAILLDSKGNIAEGTSNNIFLVKDNVLITPKLESILPGITRDAVIQIAKDHMVAVDERHVSVDELKNCDEAFITGTACEIKPIGVINNRIISNNIGPLTKKIKNLFEGITSGRNKRYDKWFTYV